MSYSLAFYQSIYMLIYVGNKVEQGLYEFTPTQTVAHDLNIPPSTTAMILRRLNRSGLIETREGANGGVRLAMPPEKITVLDIFNAVEQQRALFQMNVQFNVSGEKTTKVRQSVRQVLTNAENAMQASLGSVTLRELMNAAHPST